MITLYLGLNHIAEYLLAEEFKNMLETPKIMDETIAHQKLWRISNLKKHAIISMIALMVIPILMEYLSRI